MLYLTDDGILWNETKDLYFREHDLGKDIPSLKDAAFLRRYEIIDTLGEAGSISRKQMEEHIRFALIRPEAGLQDLDWLIKHGFIEDDEAIIV